MFYYLILLMVLAAEVVSGADLQWRFNRASNVLEFRYETKAQHCYMLVRYDIKANYYDCVHFVETTTNNVPVFVEVNPLVTGEDLNPNPSGQCYFYLVETSIETPKLHFISGAFNPVRKTRSLLP